MAKNDQDITQKLTAPEVKPSPENNKKLGRLQKVRKKASQPLILVGISVAFVGILALIYAWYSFHWTGWLLFLFILIEILLLILLIQAGYTAQWIGFSGYDKETKEYASNEQPTKITREYQPGKTVWDWLQLLIIPLVLAGATIGFGWWQAQLAYGQHQNDLKIAYDNRQNDMQLANDQQQEAILQTYLDNMSDLLLNKDLSNSKPGEAVSEVARERTLTTLRRLDAKHNKIVLQFLQDAHLIGIQNAVINLSNADLSNDDLSDANLSATDLSNATLSDAHLDGATLSDTNLSNADLNGATLSKTILNDATLSDATLNGAILSKADLYGAILNGADLSKATLSDAHLDGATLNGANLNGANLNNAHLNGAILSYANLSNAHLDGAILSYANLSNAILNDATLSKANLSNVGNLTQPQLNEVYSCTNAILSTGLTCYPNRSSSGTVTLTYWYTETPAETPVILQLINQFQQQNPNIKINAVYQPFGQAQTAFVTAAQAGNAPDVFRSDVGWVTEFASQGYLLNIGSRVSQSDLSDYLSVPLSYDQYHGGLYGLPQVTDFLALLYNQDEFRKAGITSPPATMSDFEADAMKIVQSRGAKYGFETSGASYYVLPFLWAFGGGMIDPHNNNILVNNAGSVAGLNFLLKLQNTDKVMPAKVDFNNGYNNMVNDFKSGETVMIFDGPYEVSNILTGSAFTGNTSNLGIAAIPIGPSGDQPRSPVGGQSYVISADTRHAAEAYKFISFMSSTASQVAIAKANHTLPTRNSAYQDPLVSSDPFISAFLSIQKKTAVARPTIPQGGLLFYAFDPNIGAALDGAKSPADALNAVAEDWKQLLAGSQGSP